tara:strand:+ start:2158 stop:2289 length:132 start_codon:yes stop_codon:yes gene_type:complete
LKTDDDFALQSVYSSINSKELRNYPGVEAATVGTQSDGIKVDA